MEKITLIGNIGQDAKTVDYQNNKFLSFSVGCSTVKKNGEERIEKTNWYDCTFDNMKFADYIKKGTKVYIEGIPKAETYWSEAQNKWLPKVRVFIQRIELLSAKKDDSTNQAPAEQNSGTPTPPPVESAGNGGDDLPF